MGSLFNPSEKFDGIRPINIYFMRLIYVLMAFVMGMDAWGYIFSNAQPWGEEEAVAWSVWGAFAILALLGMFRTVDMIPILLLEILYKCIWLFLFALPLMQEGKLEGSGSEETVFAFLLVLLPILAMPWGYVFDRYILGRRRVLA